MGIIIDVNSPNWEQEVLKSNTLTVVDFWHNRCPYCLMLSPTYDELAEEYKGKIKFVRMNVLEDPGNREITLRYGVMGTPTLVFFCEGRPVGQVVGFMAKAQLKKEMDDILEKHKECVKQSTELKI
jgi:thioredoxin 1